MTKTWVVTVLGLATENAEAGVEDRTEADNVYGEHRFYVDLACAENRVNVLTGNEIHQQIGETFREWAEMGIIDSETDSNEDREAAEREVQAQIDQLHSATQQLAFPVWSAVTPRLLETGLSRLYFIARCEADLS